MSSRTPSLPIADPWIMLAVTSRIAQSSLRYRECSVSDLVNNLESSCRRILGCRAGQSFGGERSDEC